MTIAKGVVGYLSGSLALISEAAHSGLDFAATVMTWYAVRISGKPPTRSTNTDMARSRASPR